jgi:hypothetical protein
MRQFYPKSPNCLYPKGNPNWVLERQFAPKPIPKHTQKFAFHENSQKVLGGEEDAGKIATEVGVKVDTVYVVKSELKRYMSGKLPVRKKLPGKAYWKVLPIRLLVSFQRALYLWVRKLRS